MQEVLCMNNSYILIGVNLIVWKNMSIKFVKMQVILKLSTYVKDDPEANIRM